MSPSGNTLVFLNGGLGNFVIAAPVLAALAAARPGSRFHLPEHDVLGQPWFTDALGPSGLAATYPPLWRRCQPDDIPAMLEFMAGNGVTTLLNFRCEWIGADGRYLAFREQARRAGIECLDFHQLPPAEQVKPIAEQMVSVLARAGVELPEPDWAFLSHLRQGRRPSGIGCYVGASTGVKRWQAARWNDCVAHLARLTDGEITIGAGPVEAERRLAARVVSDSGGLARPVEFSDVRALIDWIAGLEVLVSNDTLAVHLAAGLGCPVVALYLATDGRIWSPVTLPGRLEAVQSATALRCRAMKPDGTCRRFYLGCPAPCRNAVSAADVVSAADRILERVG
ncbi:glycosyltransferase family 9 protein [Catellatospora sp. NPDC049609]|uniref:glycosyltransferase family 9 protein n=1 Tax=Catellatospora sp. NPDC049609 TaxID=3155505 RepID=UPI003445A2F1